MNILSINTSTSYPIYLDAHLLETALFTEYCTQLNKRIVIITDNHLKDSIGKKVQHILQEHGLSSELLTFPAGEINKTRDTKQMLEDTLFNKQYGRDTCLIALGGGVVTDLVGFLAATYCRGIPVIYIPTTLLAMVDASIGGKTGVNTPYGKNLIGTFTQPLAVFIDTYLLHSLPENELRNGIAEMIKHSLIADAGMFNCWRTDSNKILKKDSHFLINLIYENCLIKKNIIEQDEKDNGIRQLLNFGHTIGHVIETIENYQISHGEAIAIGMLVESYLSVQYGYLNKNTLITIQETLNHYGFLLRTSAFQNKNLFKKIIMQDKKSVKNIPHITLLNEIGKPHYANQSYTMPIDISYLDHALDWAEKHFS